MSADAYQQLESLGISGRIEEVSDVDQRMI